MFSIFPFSKSLAKGLQISKFITVISLTGVKREETLLYFPQHLKAGQEAKGGSSSKREPIWN